MKRVARGGERGEVGGGGPPVEDHEVVSLHRWEIGGQISIHPEGAPQFMLSALCHGDVEAEDGGIPVAAPIQL